MMFGNKLKYRYYIVYYGTKDDGWGFASLVYNTNDKIKSGADIQNVTDNIRRDNGLKSVIIINYKRIRKTKI